MGFNDTDLHALKVARECGFVFDVVDANPRFGKKINKVQPPTNTSCSDPGNVLVKALEALERIDGDVATIWLDVPMKKMPPYIGTALRKTGFAMQLVVTHMNTCSHQPGIPLAESLKNALEKLPVHGQVWHPFTGQLVFSGDLTD